MTKEQQAKLLGKVASLIDAADLVGDIPILKVISTIRRMRTLDTVLADSGKNPLFTDKWLLKKKKRRRK